VKQPERLEDVMEGMVVLHLSQEERDMVDYRERMRRHYDYQACAIPERLLTIRAHDSLRHGEEMKKVFLGALNEAA